MILEFSNPEQFKKWYESCALPEKYIVFVTNNKEIILRPIKSTNTYDYGYYEATTKDKLDCILKELEESRYSIFNIKSIHWDKEKFSNVVL